MPKHCPCDVLDKTATELSLRAQRAHADELRQAELDTRAEWHRAHARVCPRSGGRCLVGEAKAAANARKSPAELVREARVRLAAMTPAERRSREQEAARIASRVRGRGGFER